MRIQGHRLQYVTSVIHGVFTIAQGEDPRAFTYSHVRHQDAPLIPSKEEETTASTSYRSWLERVRNERPAYLTITSLELPESPIPLIDSQASARSRSISDSPRSNPDGDVILDEFLEKVSRFGRDREKDSGAVRFCRIEDGAKGTSPKRRLPRDRFAETGECNGELASLEECTKRIVQGPAIGSTTSQSAVFKDCICSEISENLRINIREKTEVTRGSRSPSPEVTHTIRIAMKYHGQPEHNKSDESGELANKRHGADSNREDAEKSGKEERLSGNKNSRLREDGCCPGVNVALDFTLNCSSVQLTSRDINLRTATYSIGKNDKATE